MRKKLIITAIIAVVCSYLLHVMQSMLPFILVLKYLLAAYGFLLMGYALCPFRKQNTILYYIGVVIICVYTILTIDTFILHAITWFPGIIRFPLYSLYGIPYMLFSIFGMFLCMHRKSDLS